MKTKILLIVVFFVLAIKTSFAQLKINEYGRIGIGIDPHPSDKLLIKGNLCLTTYPEIPSPLSSWAEMKFKVGNGWPGAEIGATPGCKIAFWASGYGYNKLYASHYYTLSDTSVKTQIEPINGALEKIILLSSYSYKLKSDSLLEEKLTFGFLAHEVQNILPNIIDTVKGLMLIDYQQIISLLIGAVKEQQEVIDSLRNGNQVMRLSNKGTNEQQTIDSLILALGEMKQQIVTCCNQYQVSNFSLNKNTNTRSVLFQNKPNPFSEKTIIDFEIKEDFISAEILIFDMQGILKKRIPIVKNGKGQILINGYEFLAGMYLYSLIVDSKEIDTKHMILLN